jgi:uncharacterized protein YdeI (YjbR/CyaY-like superfamily)
MGKRDPRIDAYIARQQDFAKPILEFLRDTIHQACPECEETLKWSSPSFTYRGAILAGFAGFKEHVGFGFWKHEQVVGARPAGGMGSYGRIMSVKDLPPKKQLLASIAKAMKLEDQGVKTVRVKAEPKKPIPIPADLKAALARNRRAKATYDAFSPSHKREYLEWITDAKQAETRRRRIAQALEWMAEGKARNWKYM